VNPELKYDLSKLVLKERGNVEVGDSLEENHKTLTKEVETILNDGSILIVVGGGNDQSYCNARGLMNSLKTGNIGVVNIDAHLDVRPLLDGGLAHSGSPFRQLLTDSDFQKDGGKFIEFAAQGNQSSAEHAKFVTENGGDIHWLNNVNRNAGDHFSHDVLDKFEERDVFVSFDIDSIEGAHCPGVSCPAVRGLTAQQALDVCFEAGAHLKTRMVDLSEFNPDVEEYRTGTLVCNMIYYFLMGVVERENRKQ